MAAANWPMEMHTAPSGARQGDTQGADERFGESLTLLGKETRLGKVGVLAPALPKATYFVCFSVSF